MGSEIKFLNINKLSWNRGDSLNDLSLALDLFPLKRIKPKHEKRPCLFKKYEKSSSF